MTMFFLYILRGPKNHLYIGITKDINKRIDRHKKREGAEFTKRNKTYSLVYKESYDTYLEARRRESQIKGWKRDKKEKLIMFGNPKI